MLCYPDTDTLTNLGLGVGGQDLGSTLHGGVVGERLRKLLPGSRKAVREVCDLTWRTETHEREQDRRYSSCQDRTHSSRSPPPAWSWSTRRRWGSPALCRARTGHWSPAQVRWQIQITSHSIEIIFLMKQCRLEGNTLTFGINFHPFLRFNFHDFCRSFTDDRDGWYKAMMQINLLIYMCAAVSLTGNSTWSFRMWEALVLFPVWSLVGFLVSRTLTFSWTAGKLSWQTQMTKASNEQSPQTQKKSTC